MAAKADYKVKVTLGDSTVEIEGEEKGVVSIVKALSEVLRGTGSAVRQTTVPSSLPLRGRSTRPTESVDIRTFFKQKDPSTDIEAAAVAAYYYKYLAPRDHARDSIDAAALEEAFRLAGRRLPPVAHYTLGNARKAGYLDSVGDGSYRLNPVGFNLVEHTLGKEEAEQRKLRRRRGAKQRKKKKEAQGAKR